MEFGKVAATYGITLAAVGAVFSFLVAPFLGDYWTHWLIAGIVQAFMAATLVTASLGAIDDESPGARNAFHGAAVVILPPVALVTLSFLPLAHWPMIAWLLPGILLGFTSLTAVYGAVAEEDGEEVQVSRLDRDDDSRCDVPYCTEWSMFQVEFPAETGRKVQFKLCFGHNMEFQCESGNGKIDTLIDVKLWMNREGPWIYWGKDGGMTNDAQRATPEHVTGRPFTHTYQGRA